MKKIIKYTPLKDHGYVIVKALILTLPCSELKGSSSKTPARKIYNMHILILNQNNWLDVLEKIASIITSGTLIFAAREYIYNKKKDETSAVFEQISFFSQKIIPEQDVIRKIAGLDTATPKLKSFYLENVTVETILNKKRSEFKEQFQVVSELDLLGRQTTILNLLEELSIKIINSKTLNHSALVAIKQSFVITIEVSWPTLFIQREAFSGDSVYNNIIKIYNSWKDQINRNDQETKLNEFLKLFDD